MTKRTMTRTNSLLPPGSRVVRYARDSGHDHQIESVDQQLTVLDQACTDNHWIVVGTFIDRARPGSSDVKRDDFKRMAIFLENSPRPCDGVVLWSSARFARNTTDAQFYRALWRRAGYVVWGLIDDLPDAGDLTPVLESFLDWKNERYLVDLSKEIKRGIDAVIAKGCVPGRLPTCYKGEKVQTGETRDGKPKYNSKWVPDPRTWKRGQKAWAMRAAGYSLHRIWEETKLFGSHSGLVKFFKNEIYTGTLNFGGRRYENFVTPLCTPEQWTAVEALRKIQVHPRVRGSRYLLSGIFWCGLCGHAMVAQVSTHKPHYYRFYTCNRKRYHYRACALKRVRAEKINQLVVDKVCEEYLDEARLKQIYQRWQKTTLSQDREGHRIEVLQDEIAELDKVIERLLNSLEIGGSVHARLDKRESEREAKRLELVDLQSRPRLKLAPIESLPGVARRLREAFVSGDIENARLAVQAAVDKVILYPGKTKIFLRVPLVPIGAKP